MGRFYVSAPPDVQLWDSDDASECGRIAAFNAQLSGNIVLVIDSVTDNVVGVGVPRGVQTHVCSDSAVLPNMTPEEVARLPIVKWMMRKGLNGE